ncbi:MAG: hypothetical protein QF561_07075 [Phycisphaerales bacterium]|jgi:hypothetical protein|nr:hypothetical protein [Phycisphaerales bacterium]
MRHFCQRLARAAFVGATAVGGVIGCETTPAVTAPTDSTSTRFAPLTIEVHPLSHIYIQDDGTVVFDAAIELLDADDFPTRGTGVLELELHQGNRSGEAIMVRRTWSRDLNEAPVNAATFDRATRTYVVRETLPLAEVPRLPRLTASLRRHDGSVLTDAADLPILGPGAEPKPPAESAQGE